MRAVWMVLMLLPGLVQAGPALNIGGLYDYLEADRSTTLKRVRNTGDATAFVKVSVMEVVYDAAGQAREVSLEGLPVGERPLAASPARLIVPAGGMQAVRLLYRGERDQERYFRLRFIPVLPEKDDGFAVSDADAQAYNATLKAGVNVLTGYGSLLFVHPKQPHFKTDLVHDNTQFHVPNNGNTTVVLDHFRDCDSRGEQCEVATVHHVRPQVRKTFEKKPGRRYSFEVLEAGEKRTMEVQG